MSIPGSSGDQSVWTGNAAARNPVGSDARGTRNRNTNGNASTGTLTPYGQNPTAPPLNPLSYGAYATTVAGLQQHLAAALALQKAGIGATRSQFMLAADAAKNVRVNETVGAESDALGRGVVGGSGDLQARAQAITDSATARQTAVAARGLGIATARTGMMSAYGDYYTGLGSAQADLANHQAELANQRFQQDQFDVLQQNYQAMRKSVLQNLRNRGRTRDGVGGNGGNGWTPSWTPSWVPGSTPNVSGGPIGATSTGHPLY